MAVKYPLPCGCAAPKYISMCDTHKLGQLRRDARDLGVDRIRAERLLRDCLPLVPKENYLLASAILEFLGE